MKHMITALLFLFSFSCFAQLKITKIGVNSIPKSIQYIGYVVDAVRWVDSLGDNIVITTQTGKTASKVAEDEGYKDAALYAYHFSFQSGHWVQTWRVYDFIKECDLDMDFYFVQKSFAVTDLNKDGKAEVWIMYKKSCHGDVSPIPMKIIMYENNKKYAVRGDTKVRVSENEYMGGDFVFDETFKKGPSVFKKYAENLWSRNRAEKSGRVGDK